ncbi:MAG TPA: DUF742 domain-containing protein [Pseudonocardiaceae bacterium]|jgi:hypothetical protein|nr:DUF742 domain-containing protein [Pseudonocardiaceae bacterium]
MIRGPLDNESPDRLYALTLGRSHIEQDTLDVVTLIVTESDSEPGMQSEYRRILELCAQPTAVVEIAACMGLPVSVTKILVSDLMDAGKVSARHPATSPATDPLPSPDLLQDVLDGLQRL